MRLHVPGFRLSRYWSVALSGVICALPLFYPHPGIARANRPAESEKSGPRVASQLSGFIPTKNGQRLHLVIDLGNVVVHTQQTNQVDYRVRLEADSSQKDAKMLLKSFSMNARQTVEGVYLRGQTAGCQCRGRLWVTVEVKVPKNYNNELSTGGGNIETEDINGRL